MSIALRQDTTANHFSSATAANSLLLCVASATGSTSLPVTIGSPSTSGFSWTLADSSSYNYSYFDCFSGNVRIETPQGLVRFDEFPVDQTFEITNETGTHLAELISHEARLRTMIDMGDGLLVTLTHPMRDKEGKYVDAQILFPNHPRVVFFDPVYTLHVLSDKEADKHYILENGEVAHNKLNQTIYENGAVVIYYIAGASSMASATTTSVTISHGSGGFRLYEYTGVAASAPIDTKSQSDSVSPSTVNAGTLTTSNTDLIFVASAGGSTVGSGYTSGVTAADQYITNEAAGSVATAFGNTAAIWCSTAVAFLTGSVSVSPTGVSATFGINNPTISAGAAVSPTGVSATFALGPVFVPEPGNAYPGQVSATFTIGSVSAGTAINYGNVVTGSASLPSGVDSTYFYVRWTGWLVIDVSGTYTIGLNVQDGGDLYIGTQPVVLELAANQSAHSSVAYTQSGTVELTKNVAYPIVVEWQHGSGGSYECQLLWTPPGGSIEVIPSQNLQLTGAWQNATSGTPYPNAWYILG